MVTPGHIVTPPPMEAPYLLVTPRACHSPIVFNVPSGLIARGCLSLRRTALDSELMRTYEAESAVHPVPVAGQQLLIQRLRADRKV